MKAPNETQEQYNERQALLKLLDSNSLTPQQLARLRELSAAAISHLQFSTIK